MIGRAIWDKLPECIFENHESDLSQKSPDNNIDNLLILDVKQLNKIMKLYYFYTLKALWDG